MKYISLEAKMYNIDDYIIYVKNNTKWSVEHINFLRLINSLYFGDTLNID